MDLDLYKGQILEFASSIPRVGRLDAPDASADAHSRLCGSRITIDIKLDGNVIADYAHEPKACAIGQASASVVARTVVGLTVDDVNDGAEIMTAILKKKRLLRRVLGTSSNPSSRSRISAVGTIRRSFPSRHSNARLRYWVCHSMSRHSLR